VPAPINTRDEKVNTGTVIGKLSETEKKKCKETDSLHSEGEHRAATSITKLVLVGRHKEGEKKEAVDSVWIQGGGKLTPIA